MQYTIELYTKKKDYKRDTYFVKKDITSQVVMPIIDVQRLDRTLDTSSISLINLDHKPIRPFSRVIIRVDYGNGNVENIYRMVHDDSVSILTYGNITYRHNVELIEPTKELERHIIDNTTITNLLAYLYTDDGGILPTKAVGTQTITSQSGVQVKRRGYTTDKVFQTAYYKGASIDPNLGYEIICDYGVIPKDAKMNLTQTKVITPSGQEIINPSGTITLNETTGLSNYYLIEKKYYFRDGGLVQDYYLGITITWEIEVVEKETPVEKLPTRYSIWQVLNIILDKVTDTLTTPRLGINDRLYYLDDKLQYLKNVLSPEFTFTQNTLFGMLEEVGNYLNAIPRLIPTKNGADDYSQWTTITFDFLGGDKKGDLSNYDIVANDYELHGDNYTSAFVSNVENSFQTNNIDYVSLTEPYTNGYVSTRTEDANFEISNDGAVFKTSRPIQRIISLVVGINNNGKVHKVDITRYVKEQSDYLLLKDYARNIDEVNRLETKSTAIYYTRGENVIRGLDYYPPKRLNIDYLYTARAIQTIIAKASEIVYEGKLKDIMVNIKYVPFYSFKANQFKEVIDDNTDANELFYNQQSQGVDIESFGENMRGALMMTANVERTITGYAKGYNQIVAGDLIDNHYYAYQVNREFISNNAVKATITLSKNFNKWNDYLAIKKNYREWEISNRESVETNPISNEFCIISDKRDIDSLYDKDKDGNFIYANTLEELQSIEAEYINELTIRDRGFNTYKSAELVSKSLVNNSPIASTIEWAVCEAEKNNSNEKKSFILPCASFAMGNSVVLNFSAQDNYSAGTTSVDQLGKDYNLENFVGYTDKYGKVDNLRVALGSGNPYNLTPQEQEDYNIALINSKEINTFDTSSAYFDKSKIIVDYFTNSPFIINKDSRQQLGMTIQLNYLSDKDYIWVSPDLAKYSGFVGKQNGCYPLLAFFTKTPNRFLGLVKGDNVGSFYNIENNIEVTSLGININLESFTAPKNTVGFGIIRRDRDIDTNSRIMIYYNKALKEGEQLPNLYMQLRRKI